MIKVKGIYDGKKIELIEPVEVRESYKIIVTFVEPLKKDKNKQKENMKSTGLCGMWKDERTAEEIVKSMSTF